MMLAVALILATGAASRAEDWAQKMFQVTEHDFGTIARGAKAEYAFVFTNLYQEDVHVAGVRTTCGCTTPRVEGDSLTTAEKGAVISSINSRSFLGRQASTITVTFDKPSYAQVQLRIKVFVRTDLLLEPDGVTFGPVEQGAGSEKTISVSCTGREDWRIVEVKSAHPHITGEVAETARGPRQVSYALTVRLHKDAPPGPIREYLTLVTNDEKSPQVHALVEGEVLSEISVSPATLFMGVLRPGEKATKQIAVKGKKAFRITAVSADCGCVEVAAPSASPPKSLYLIPVTFVAHSEGRMAKTIRIETDVSATPRELPVYAAVRQ